MIAAREMSEQITLYTHSITTRLYNATFSEYSLISSGCMLHDITHIYSFIEQFKLIFIPSGFPSCVITTRGLVKVFLLCIMAKIMSTLREVQASSGGMHCGRKKQRVSSECPLCQDSCASYTVASLSVLSYIIYQRNKRGEPPNNPHVTYWQR